MLIPLDSLPPEARVWIFPIHQMIDDTKTKVLEHELNYFVKDWTSHNMALKGGASVFENKFAIIGVDESAYGASGCSIDKLMRFIQNLEGEQNISLLLRNYIYIKRQNYYQSYTLAELKKAINSNEVSMDDLYFDTTVDTKGKFTLEVLKPLTKGWLSHRILNA